MKKMIAPYLYNISHPLDVIATIHQDKLKIVLIAFLIPILLITIGIVIPKYNPVTENNMNALNLLTLLIGSIFSGVGGWKLGDAVKSWRYFYRKADDVIVKDILMLSKTSFVTQLNQHLTNDIENIASYYKKITASDIDVILEYVDKIIKHELPPLDEPMITKGL